MGLLSPLGLLQAAAFQRPQFMGPVIPAPAPQQQQRRPFQPVQPFAPQAVPNVPDAPQAPQPYTAPNVRPPGFGETLTNWTQSPLFNLGMSLLGNASSPEQWAGVGRDVRTFGQDQRQRQQQENEERRLAAQERMQGQQFGWATEDRTRQQGQRQSLEQWVATLPADQQAAARANPEAAHQAYMEATAAASQPITPFQQRQLGLQERGLGIDAMNAQANMARANLERPLRGPDARLMDEVREAAGRGQAISMLGDEFLRGNALSGTGELSRFNLSNFWDRDRASMRSASAQMRGFMRPPGSGATSDYEQRIYAMGVPDVASNTGPQNEAVMRYHYAAATLAQERRYFYEEFAARNGTLNGAEQAFQQSPQFQAVTREVPLPQQGQAAPAGQRQQGGVTPAQARAELERRERERRGPQQPGGYRGR